MIYDYEKITKPCDLFLHVLGVLRIVFDCNAFLNVPARYWNQERALNWPGRLISVLTLFLIFFNMVMVFSQQLARVSH